jgi:hypothetical protein
VAGRVGCLIDTRKGLVRRALDRFLNHKDEEDSDERKKRQTGVTNGELVVGGGRAARAISMTRQPMRGPCCCKGRLSK